MVSPTGTPRTEIYHRECESADIDVRQLDFSRIAATLAADCAACRRHAAKLRLLRAAVAFYASQPGSLPVAAISSLRHYAADYFRIATPKYCRRLPRIHYRADR